MLQNEYLIVKIGVDVAENEPIGKSDLQNERKVAGSSLAPAGVRPRAMQRAARRRRAWRMDAAHGAWTITLSMARSQLYQHRL